MAKQKRKLTAAEKRARRERKKKYMTIFINGRQKRVPREPTIDGLPVDEFIRRNADPIWLHQNEMWELMEPDGDWTSELNALPVASVPVSETALRRLLDLSERSGRPMFEMLDRAIEAYHRELLNDELNAAMQACAEREDDCLCPDEPPGNEGNGPF